MICAEQYPEFLDWANRHLGVNFMPSDCRWITSISPENEVLGVVIFSRFTPWNCELSTVSVSPKFLTRKLLWMTFDYIFNQCGLCRATSVIESDNEKALKLNRGLGFKDEGVLKNWYGKNKDGIVLGLLKEDCKWHSTH